MAEPSAATTKTAKLPGPDHPISITRNPNRLLVSVAGKRLAATEAALTLRESTYPPVHYIPRGDVDLTQLERSTHATYCPYKGDCAYFSIPAAGARGIDAVWTYEHPHRAVADIRDHLAFYPDRVELVEEPRGG